LLGTGVAAAFVIALKESSHESLDAGPRVLAWEETWKRAGLASFELANHVLLAILQRSEQGDSIPTRAVVRRLVAQQLEEAEAKKVAPPSAEQRGVKTF
jgi:hypothetical protein